MRFKEHWNNLEFSTRLILFAGLLIQIITAINAIGYLHPDQHFQLIEFAGFKLGLTERALLPADFDYQYSALCAGLYLHSVL